MAQYVFPDDAKIAVAGDWHANFRWVSQMIHYLAKNHQITHILHVGDFGIMSATGWGTTQYIQCLKEATEQTGVTVLFVRGNHDNPDFLNSLPLNENGLAPLVPNHPGTRVFFIPDGSYMTWRGKTILGIGGAVSIDRQWRYEGIDWWVNEVIPEDILDTVLPNLPAEGVDVLIAHDAPALAGVPLDPAFAASFNQKVVQLCEDHRNAFQETVNAIQPRNIIHGHYHVRYEGVFSHPTLGYDTRCIGLDCDKSRFSGAKAAGNWVSLAEVLDINLV